MIYQKTNSQTQNKLREIFDIFNFTSENIYNITDNKTKKRINTYIERLERTRLKNSEILELLIYFAYIEEQNKMEEQEKQIMYEDANYYYEERTERSR